MTKLQKLIFKRFVQILGYAAIIIVTACSKDDEASIAPEPSISEVEVGSGNNGIGVIGRDFHLNVEVLAGNKIDSITIKIQPLPEETYTSDWRFELNWLEFKGAKNATVHKHFDIPEDAVEGKYDFIIIVKDENGTQLEQTFSLEIIDPANLAVDPYLYLWDFYTTDNQIYQYVNETLENPEDVNYEKGDTIQSSATINKVKGDGSMYIVFIKKSAEHRPETVDDIDFSKVIVYDTYEHESWEDVDSFSNIIYGGIRPVPKLVIGASADNNTPEPNSIDGEKTWENGDYYMGLIYTNYTYKISVYHYVDVTLEGF
ncbi:hypothetical protein GCM10011506_09590 [Marivirga lumbricoides]|uniref:DUF4625 domain-containing protein n=1 Tax=Marivirga lumbricoides TaxID=1046115 RepID=A0ABQ1LLA0_9BACT|nr:hypothetical protein GCM10011506_09590 [Marivirga lumbricoides]